MSRYLLARVLPSLALFLFALHGLGQGPSCNVANISNVTANSANIQINYSIGTGGWLTLITQYGSTFYVQLSIENYNYYTSSIVGKVGQVNLGMINSQNCNNFSNGSVKAIVNGLQPNTTYNLCCVFYFYNDAGYTQLNGTSQFPSGGPNYMTLTTLNPPTTHIVDSINKFFSQQNIIQKISQTSAKVYFSVDKGINWETLNQNSILRKLTYGPAKLAYSTDKANWTYVPGIFQPDTFVVLNDLQPDTKYYIRSQTSFDTVPDNTGTQDYTLYSNINKFRTLPFKPPTKIKENFITSGNSVACDSGFKPYRPPQILATIPKGGTGKYEYQWQRSANGRSWQNADNADNTSQNYQPLTYINWQPPVFYRRIVFSGLDSDTSQPMTLTSIPPNYTPFVTVTQESYVKNGALLVSSIEPLLGNFQTQWTQISNVNTVAASLPNGNLFIPSTISANNSYLAYVSYGNNCPQYSSKIIGISAPDGDKNIYATLQIGAQTWMINNLRTTKYNDGTPLIKYVTNDTWASTQRPGYSWYNNDSLLNAVPYGALYNGLTIQGEKNVCPSGWHVATATDWSTLATYVTGPTGANAAVVLKSMNASWLNPNFANNIYNFNALPGGERKVDGTFSGKMSTGSWFAPGSPTSICQMTNGGVNIWFGFESRNSGNSIRCIKDFK